MSARPAIRNRSFDDRARGQEQGGGEEGALCRCIGIIYLTACRESPAVTFLIANAVNKRSDTAWIFSSCVLCARARVCIKYEECALHLELSISSSVRDFVREFEIISFATFDTNKRAQNLEPITEN